MFHLDDYYQSESCFCEIDRFVESIHNPDPEALAAMEKDLENEEFSWMDNYVPPKLRKKWNGQYVATNNYGPIPVTTGTLQPK